MKLVKIVTSLLSLSTLVACGGGNDLASPYPNAYGAPYGMQPAMQQPYGQALGQNPNPMMMAPQQGQVPNNGSAMQSFGNSTSLPATLPATATQQSVAKSGTAAPAKKTTTTATATNTAKKPTATKAPAAPAPTTGPSAEQYLTQARQAMSNLQSLSAVITTFEKGITPGQGQIRYFYRQPGQVKIEVMSSSDASKNGVKLTFQVGSSQVKARATGLLSIMAVTLPMSDPKVKSGRQYLINQIDFSATVPRLAAAAAQAKVVGKANMDGSEVILLEFTPNGNHFDPRVTKERVAFDAQSFLIRAHEMYEGNTLVYSSRVNQMQINPSLSASTFDV